MIYFVLLSATGGLFWITKNLDYNLGYLKFYPNGCGIGAINNLNTTYPKGKGKFLTFR